MDRSIGFSIHANDNSFLPHFSINEENTLFRV